MAEIVATEDVMGGQPRIEGRRISVVQIVEWVNEDGLAPETVATEFDLDMADVYGALAYYYDNVESMTEWRERRDRRVRESRAAQPSPDSFSERA